MVSHYIYGFPLLDRRLVVTFFGFILALVMHRYRHEEAWLRELGQLLGRGHAEAGRKRIQKLAGL